MRLSATLMVFLTACTGPDAGEDVPGSGSTPVQISLGDLQAFDLSDPAAWSTSNRVGPDGEEVTCLELVGSSDYSPPHRSPRSIALVQDLVVGDFTLVADVMQTGREYGHRDFCLFFGFEDPANFYYVHLASSPDNHAHNVFLVDDAARVRIAEIPAAGVDWGTERWHRLRLERELETGLIRVWFDEEQVLETTDTSHGRGRLGFGSFDDTGSVGSVWLQAPDAALEPTSSPF